MARKVPTLPEAAAAASAAGHPFKNPEEADQGRYKIAMGVPLTAHLQYEVIMALVDTVAELEARIEALENA